MMKRVAKAITFAIAFYLGPVFSHPNAWFMRATEIVSPSSWFVCAALRRNPLGLPRRSAA
jgi:hypothetical protein